MDEAGCENFKALFGTSGISDRLGSRDRCSESPPEVHHNTSTTHLKKEHRQAPVELVLWKMLIKLSTYSFSFSFELRKGEWINKSSFSFGEWRMAWENVFAYLMVKLCWRSSSACTKLWLSNVFATYIENILHCNTPHTCIKLFFFNDICDPLNWFHIWLWGVTHS